MYLLLAVTLISNEEGESFSISRVFANLLCDVYLYIDYVEMHAA